MTEETDQINKTNVQVEGFKEGEVFPEIQSEEHQMSEDCAELFAALAKAQGQMDLAKRDKFNPFHKSKYADLASCWAAVRTPLAENGLAVIQIPLRGRGYKVHSFGFDKDKKPYENQMQAMTIRIKTLLTHSSGQFVSSVIEMRPAKTDPQTYGLTMSYARRYALQGMVGIASEEDDGVSGSDQPRNRPETPPAANRGGSRPAPPKGGKKVTEAQIKRLFAIARSKGITPEDVKDGIKQHFGLESPKDLDMARYDQVIKKLEANPDQNNAQ